MSSPIDMKCPNCEKVLKVPPAVFGKKIKCKHCEHAFVVHGPGRRAGREARREAGRQRPPARRPPAAKKNAVRGRRRRGADQDRGDRARATRSPRCPHCAKELDPPDAIVCIHCGFNNVTRAKAETKKVWAPTIEDWIKHLLARHHRARPSSSADRLGHHLPASNMREWLDGSFLEMDEKDAAGQQAVSSSPPGSSSRDLVMSPRS